MRRAHSLFSRSAPSAFFAACLLFFLAAAPGWATTSKKDAGDDAAKGATVTDDAIERFRRHCVRVYIHGKSHEGKAPAVGDFGDDIRYERPTPVGGYWWDDNHVLIDDPVLQDQYIRYIEISLPNSDKLYSARVAGRFVKLQAMLLEVLPDEDGKTPEAVPLQFEDGFLEDAMVLGYVWDEGEWRIVIDSGIGTAAVSDSGRETVEFGSSGVLVDEDGAPIGLAFGEKADLEDDGNYWQGRELSYTKLLSAVEMTKAADRLREQLAAAVLESRFRIRINVDDDDEENGMRDWTFDLSDGQLRGGDAEVRAPALVVDERHLLVPLSLPPEGIARIEDITIVDADGEETDARFVGAYRDYMAVLVATEKKLPIEKAPAGFSMLYSASGRSAEQSLPRRPYMEYIQRWSIDYALGRRREMSDYDRWLGSFRGYQGDPVVLTRTNEKDGGMAFDVDGNLVALALTPRLLKSRDMAGVPTNDIGATPGFRPIDFLAGKLSAADAFDPSLMPVDENQGQRLIDLGVEFQPLDRNTARLFHVSRETRGGHIGLLVTHVYPGTMAAAVGLQEHDVLLRMFINGKNEPLELRSSGYAFAGAFDMGDMSSESFQSFLRYMPPPWPSRENVVSTLLTAAGAGRSVVLEYMREGEPMRAEFTTSYYEADYRSAKKERFTALGLTVKPVTYEVARYFGRADLSGVIVSKVEEGGKASVAGLNHYLLITHVNGAKIADDADFRAKLEPFESGKVNSVELTVEVFGKTRLVKIE